MSMREYTVYPVDRETYNAKEKGGSYMGGEIVEGFVCPLTNRLLLIVAYYENDADPEEIEDGEE